MELPSDPNEELENWVNDIELDLLDLEEESEELFDKQMARYRAKMKRWTAKKRTNRGKNGSGGDATDNESDNNTLRRPPAPPQKPNSREFKKVIEKRYKDIRRRPGEPKILLELTNTASLTSLAHLPEE